MRDIYKDFQHHFKIQNLPTDFKESVDTLITLDLLSEKAKEDFLSFYDSNITRNGHTHSWWVYMDKMCNDFPSLSTFLFLGKEEYNKQILLGQELIYPKYVKGTNGLGITKRIFPDINDVLNNTEITFVEPIIYSLKYLYKRHILELPWNDTTTDISIMTLLNTTEKTFRKMPSIGTKKIERIKNNVKQYLLLNGIKEDDIMKYPLYAIDEPKRKSKPIKHGRAMKLLNAMVNDLLVDEKVQIVIQKLLSIGFKEEELIDEFNFCIEDVENVIENMDS